LFTGKSLYGDSGFFIFFQSLLKDFPRRLLENVPRGLKCVGERNWLTK
jgi:hypothetical protein